MREPSIADNWSSLSFREREVLSYAAQGQGDKMIAASMGITINTLRTFWSRIRAKLGDHPRTSFVAAYVQNSLGARGHVHTERSFDWVIDFDRWTITILAGFAQATYGQISMPLDTLNTVYGEQLPRVWLLLEAVRLGHIDCFHITVPSFFKEVPELSSAYCVAERDDHGRALRLWGKRVPSFDFRRTTEVRAIAGQFGYDSDGRDFWADRECREILGIPSHALDVREAFVSQIAPEDQDRLVKVMCRVQHSADDIADLAVRVRKEDDSVSYLMIDLKRRSENGHGLQIVGTVKTFV